MKCNLLSIFISFLLIFAFSIAEASETFKLDPMHTYGP